VFLDYDASAFMQICEEKQKVSVPNNKISFIDILCIADSKDPEVGMTFIKLLQGDPSMLLNGQPGQFYVR